MLPINCIAITAIFKSQKGSLLGKRRLMECGLPMRPFNKYIWNCEEGHQRVWPPQERDLLKKGYTRIALSERLVAHHKSVSYKDSLLYLIHIRSYKLQTHY